MWSTRSLTGPVRGAFRRRTRPSERIVKWSGFVDAVIGGCRTSSSRAGRSHEKTPSTQSAGAEMDAARVVRATDVDSGRARKHALGAPVGAAA